MAYIQYILERTNEFVTGVQQLDIMEKSDLSLVEEFKIFRYKHFIKEQIMEVNQKSNKNIDVSLFMRYESSFQVFQQNISKSAEKHIIFWGLLEEDRPEMCKFTECGMKIGVENERIEKGWERLQEMFPNDPKALKLYGNFLIQVLNDQIRGGFLLNKYIYIYI